MRMVRIFQNTITPKILSTFAVGTLKKKYNKLKDGNIKYLQYQINRKGRYRFKPSKKMEFLNPFLNPFQDEMLQDKYFLLINNINRYFLLINFYFTCLCPLFYLEMIE